MAKSSIELSTAFFAGVILAIMIFINSALGKITSPVFAAWVAHGVGTIGSVILVLLFSDIKNQSLERIPLWAFCGGVTGAMTVWLASITVNSALGLFGSLILMISGQVVFGIFLDRFGLLGAKKRNLTKIDFTISIIILVGCALIMKGHS